MGNIKDQARLANENKSKLKQSLLGFNMPSSTRFESYGDWIRANLTSKSTPTEVVKYNIAAIANNDSYGIIVGADNYKANDNVVLVAYPFDGCRFVRWTNYKGETVCMESEFALTVVNSEIYIAHFEEIPKVRYTLTLSSNPKNTCTFTKTPNLSTYEVGTTVNVTVNIARGYRFVKWSDGDTSQSRSLVMNSNINLTAEMTADKFTVTVKTDDESMGTVTGGGTYDYNTTATIKATPMSGYAFKKWSDGNTEQTRTVVVTDDVTYTAYFEKVIMYYYVTSNSYAEINKQMSGWTNTTDDIINKGTNWLKKITLVCIPESYEAPTGKFRNEVGTQNLPAFEDKTSYCKTNMNMQIPDGYTVWASRLGSDPGDTISTNINIK